MASFTRTMRLGAGLAGLGYGVYRLARGRNDWLTSTFMTTGLAVAMNAVTGRRVQTSTIASIANAVTRGVPEMSRTAVHAVRAAAPDALVNSGWMP
ncbi:MAG TPA: hypothetical protein VNT75_11525 [Symbiobacteriaceae bacterium]|nr:hypothetical protein [Symbiobacteriaceae bacterium]